MKRRFALVLAGLGLPAVVLAAPAKPPVAQPEALAVTPPVPEGAPSKSLVTDEMRSVSDSASAAAEEAIAKLRAAQAAIAAEKAKSSEGSGEKPTSVKSGAPSEEAPARKSKPVERLESVPVKGGKPAPVIEQSSSPKAETAPAATAPVEAPKTAVNPKSAPKEKDLKQSASAPGVEPAAPTPTPSAVIDPKAEPKETAKEAAQKPVTPAADASAAAAAALGGAPQAAPSAEGTPAPDAAAEPPKKKSRFGSDDALGDAAKKKGKGKTKEPVVKLTPEQQKAAEIKAFCDKAREAIKRGEEEVARGLLESLVAVQLPDGEKKMALVEVAAVYEEKGDLTRAIAIYEKLCTVLESDVEMPSWLLKLGLLYRDAGAFQMAISRYYGVIQLSMKVGSSDFQRFQALSRQAQREIANTYFMKGDFEQAQKFYNMALRSDLPKEERAVALFRAAHCTFMRNDMSGAINALERFLKDFSRHASAAEARYMLATAYRAEARPQDAYDTVIDLLRDAKSKQEQDPKAWAFWQKKAGNEFANDYYQRGEFVNAVTIYQALAAIEASPEWRWPVVYQMGLCFERLRIEPRAGECYKYIIDENKKPEFRWRKMPQSVANLVQMASWRVEQLEWEGMINSKLRTVAGADITRPIRGR